MLEQYYTLLEKFVDTLSYVGCVKESDTIKLYLIHHIISAMGADYAKDHFTEEELDIINMLADKIESDCGCFSITGFVRFIELWKTGKYTGEDFQIQYINDDDLNGLYNALIISHEITQN